jgi:hypothetical protein
MKALIFAVAAAVTLAVLPSHNAAAHGPGRVSSYISFGIGYGYPFYRPYPHRFGGSYVGISVWPRPLVTRASTKQRSAESGVRQLYVYPAAGQSEQQLADDRYDCHVWSVGQTNFDPTLGAGSRQEAEEYARAISACLEARNYVVR